MSFYLEYVLLCSVLKYSNLSDNKPWGSVVVKALRRCSDGPGIDSRWCHWGIFPWFPPTEPASESEYQVFLLG